MTLLKTLLTNADSIDVVADTADLTEFIADLADTTDFIADLADSTVFIADLAVIPDFIADLADSSDVIADITDASNFTADLVGWTDLIADIADVNYFIADFAATNDFIAASVMAVIFGYTPCTASVARRVPCTPSAKGNRVMVPAIIRDSFGNQDIVSDIIWDSLTPGAHTVTVTAFPQLITDIACNRHYNTNNNYPGYPVK